MRAAEWRVPALLVVLGLVPAIAGTARLAGLAADEPVTAANARFITMPWPVTLHLLAALPYSLAGAFQFAPGFRRRHPRWHRTAGRILGLLGLVVAITGLWMTLTYPWPAGDGPALYRMRLGFGAGMAVAIALGVAAILRRDVRGHGAWMTRGYAIGMGAGTQTLTHLPWFVLMDTPPGETARAVMMGAGWAINLVVAEWAIRRPARPASTSPAPRSLQLGRDGRGGRVGYQSASAFSTAFTRLTGETPSGFARGDDSSG